MNSPLSDQLATIARELAALDISGARERLRSAEAELASLLAGGPNLGYGVAPSSPPGAGLFLTADHQRLEGHIKNANAALVRSEARAVDLRREAERITTLLNAGKRIKQAQADVLRAQETADASAADLAGAKATCDRLGKAIEAEKSEAAAALDASANAMLEAARTGADAGTVPVRPDKLAPLQAALAGAEAERDRISTRHTSNLAAVGTAQRLVREAEADASEADYRAAEAAFIALAAQHVVALTRAGRQAPFIAFHDKVLAAAQSLEAAS